MNLGDISLNLLSLNCEILQKIFTHLYLEDIAAIKLVCKYLKEISEKDNTVSGLHDWHLIRDAVIFNGEIVLTKLRTSALGAAICKRKINTSQNSWIRVSFELYAGDGLQEYSSERDWCGDGISFFFVDAMKHDGKSIGQSGSGLGYTNRFRRPGIPHGVLGIGFDEWGNYVLACEGKDGLKSTVEGFYEWSVCLRGAGNDYTGYPFIKNHQFKTNWYSLWTKVEILLEIKGKTGYLSLVMENSKMKQCEVFKNEKLDVELPPYIAFGFAASTGAAINNHGIRNVKITEKFYADEIVTVIGKETKFS